MPFVLTSASVLSCGHQGKFVLVPSQTKLKVDGNPVLVEGDLEKATIAGCTTPAPGKLCTKVSSVIVGVAITMAVDGKKVLLDTAMGLTDGVPAPAPWSVTSAGQTKLQAD